MGTMAKTPRFQRNINLNAQKTGPAEPPLDTPGVGAYDIKSTMKIEYKTQHMSFGDVRAAKGGSLVG